VVAGDAARVEALITTGGGAVVGRAGGAALTIVAGEARVATTASDAGAAWHSLGERM
jgi:hypothetical protein